MTFNRLLFLLCIPLLVACVPIQPEASMPTPVDSTAAANQETTQPSDTSAALTPQAALERLFLEPLQAEAWFSAEFLNQVPAAQISQIVTQLTQQLGAFQRVDGEASPFTLVFELGTIPTQITLDAQGRIIGLFLGSPTLNVTSIEEAIASINELDGEISVLVTKNGNEVVSLNADTPLGVGSAFKLAVLAVLQEQIATGLHAWDEVVLLAPAWKAPPSSILKDWPDDSPVTLHTLATLMISVSDNTAADALLNIVGREAVEAVTARNRPFLTVQELFKLKSTPNAELLAAYQNGDETTRRQILETLDSSPLPSLQELAMSPILDVEWFFTSRELCDLMAQVEQLPLMTVSPGPASAQADRWDRIAYKGGSEAGVLNLTSWLQRENGDHYCVVLTQNNPNALIDEADVVSRYLSLLSVIE